jgi:hypothetical protein
VIWVKGEQKYFCKGGWTGTSENSPLICPSGYASGTMVSIAPRNDGTIRELWLHLPSSSLQREELKQDHPAMSRAPPVSIFSRRWITGRAIFVSIAVLYLLASPARSPAQDAGVSGIAPGPGNVNGLNNSIRDPSGIGNAARIPALPQPTITPVTPPTLAPSSGYRSFSPPAGYRRFHVQRTAEGKPARLAKKSRHSAAKAHVRDEDTRIDHGVISICRGC